ncbi:MAG: hypothetical protein ACOYN0_00430, partial [Phycisphaerales bacterium]
MDQRALRAVVSAVAVAVAQPSAHCAYRITSPDPSVQTITDIPLAGYASSNPAASTGTARRAALAFDGGQSGSGFQIVQDHFSPDSTNATTLRVGPGQGAGFRSGDLVRIARSGEVFSVAAVFGDALLVARGRAGTSPAPIFNGDSLTIPSRNTSLVCWYYCEQEAVGELATVWELGQRSAGAETFALAVRRDPGSGRFEAGVGGGAPLAIDLPFDPRGRWLFVSLAQVNAWSATADELYLTVFDPATGTTFVSEPRSFVTPPSTLIPDVATIGDRYHIASGPRRSAPGICLPAIVAEAIVDGRNAVGGASTVAAAALARDTGLSGQVTLSRYAACVWSANTVAGALGGGLNDSRAGLRDAALHVLDVNRSFLAQRHQFGSGARLRGVTSVDPYLYGAPGFRVARPAYDGTIGVGAYPATRATFEALGGAQPRGEVPPKSHRLARMLKDGRAHERLRVGVLSNSRSVYQVPYRARLSDGRFLDRSFAINFLDSGFVCQAPVYDNGLIVGRIIPVPWCGWSSLNQRTGAYGVDCEAELPRCWESRLGAGTVVPPSVAMRSLQDSTLGSRFGVFSPVATRVPATGYPGPISAGSLDNYRGSHAAVRLLPGYSARFTVRPESGLPASDPLVVTMYVLNHPTSSAVSARAAAAMSQGGSEIWSEAVQTPALGRRSPHPPPAPKVVASVVEPRVVVAALQTEYGSITVDDSDGEFAGIEPGDMVQFVDALGSGAPDDEAFLVRQVTRAPSGLVTLSYDWLPRKFPVRGDLVTFIKGEDVFRKITVEIGPAHDGTWRGLEVSAANDGDGVLLWGFAFENPARNGIVTIPIGRSGCGSLIQSNRWPRQAPPGGRSLMRRILDEFALDTLVISTADQGTDDGQHVSSNETVIDLIRQDSPRTECVLYATGPEYAGEDRVDKSDIGRKFDVCVAMQLASSERGVPMTSFFFDP